jgi:hypothetical protein
MNCNEFREHVIDLATSGTPGEARAHADECAGCAAELNSFRQTMSMLDQWAAPADTSPYFMTRLRARMHEESAPARGWLQWFRNPALAVAMMVLMVLSVSLFRSGTTESNEASPQRSDLASLHAKPGTAVGDLLDLDKNHDLLNDFALLDDLEQNQ